ncbi:hypothetical protein BPY_22980 [Bifidobacterium psychraerophilum]|uniref:hypothetical protein n=1 Tax=Bifidobacterium psychraerophilum TaxID=218140 RepID=UPI00311404FA
MSKQQENVRAYIGEIVSCAFADDKGEQYPAPHLEVKLFNDLAVSHKNLLMIELPVKHDPAKTAVDMLGKLQEFFKNTKFLENESEEDQ